MTRLEAVQYLAYKLLKISEVYTSVLLAGYLQNGRSENGISLRPRGPADISPKTDPSSLPVLVPV